jgi:creatinine amidohydrolase
VARGIDKLVLVNGHGGNYVLSNVVQEANAADRSMALFPVREDWDRARQEAGCVGSTGQDMHAGELEVSLLLHADPRLVGATNSERDHLAHPRPFLAIAGIGEYTKTGVIGLPSHGTTAKGITILDSLATSFAAHHDLLKTVRRSSTSFS